MARNYKKSNKSNPDRKTRDELRSELSDKVDGLVDRLADLTDEAQSSQVFKDWLKVQSKFHHYSFNNTFLILSQCLGASRVASGKQWRQMGRYIKKDEKAIWIWAPSKYTKFEEVEESQADGSVKKVNKAIKSFMSFIPVPVFDVSQTDGEALPVLNYRISGDDQGLLPLLEKFAAEKGIQVNYLSAGSGSLRQCNGVSLGKRIQVLETLQGAERASTLIHEIAHELLHWTEGNQLDTENHSRSTMEVEAEGVAFVTLSAMGFDMTNSSFYLAAWKGDKAKVKESLGAITKTAKEVINYLQDKQEESSEIDEIEEESATDIAA
jgi:antirestriction protein ArdC